MSGSRELRAKRVEGWRKSVARRVSRIEFELVPLEVEPESKDAFEVVGEDIHEVPNDDRDDYTVWIAWR